MMFLDRDVCAVLQDMEQCCESLNFAPMKGLVIEARILSSRIETLMSHDEGDYGTSVRRLLAKQREWNRLFGKIRAAGEELKDILNTDGIEKKHYPMLSKILEEENF